MDTQRAIEAPAEFHQGADEGVLGVGGARGGAGDQHAALGRLARVAAVQLGARRARAAPALVGRPPPRRKPGRPAKAAKPAARRAGASSEELAGRVDELSTTSSTCSVARTRTSPPARSWRSSTSARSTRAASTTRSASSGRRPRRPARRPSHGPPRRGQRRQGEAGARPQAEGRRGRARQRGARRGARRGLSPPATPAFRPRADGFLSSRARRHAACRGPYLTNGIVSPAAHAKPERGRERERGTRPRTRPGVCPRSSLSPKRAGDGSANNRSRDRTTRTPAELLLRRERGHEGKLRCLRRGRNEPVGQQRGSAWRASVRGAEPGIRHRVERPPSARARPRPNGRRSARQRSRERPQEDSAPTRAGGARPRHASSSARSEETVARVAQREEREQREVRSHGRRRGPGERARGFFAASSGAAVSFTPKEHSQHGERAGHDRHGEDEAHVVGAERGRSAVATSGPSTAPALSMLRWKPKASARCAGRSRGPAARRRGAGAVTPLPTRSTKRTASTCQGAPASASNPRGVGERVAEEHQGLLAVDVVGRATRRRTSSAPRSRWRPSMRPSARRRRWTPGRPAAAASPCRTPRR